MAAEISVIMPVYNRENVLKRAIESVIAQHFSEWELLIVDDCSTDNTFEEARSYAKSDERIRIFRAQRNAGAGAARNLAIRNSSGKYIAFLDSDDAFHSSFLQESLPVIKASDESYGFTYTGVSDISELSGNKLPERSVVWRLPVKYQKKRKPYLYQLQVGTAAGIVLKREVLDRVGLFDESIKAAEDTDFFIRVSEFYRGYPIDKVLIFKDQGSLNRLTSSFRKLSEAYMTMIVKNQADINEDEELVTRWYYKSMWLNFYSADLEAARQHYQTLKKRGYLTLKFRMVYIAGKILSPNAFIGLHRMMNKIGG